MTSETLSSSQSATEGDVSAHMRASSQHSISRTPEGLAALSSTSQPVIITDCTQADNPIVYVNLAFRRLTGYRYSEVLGQNCRFLQGPETDPAVVANLRNAISSGIGIQAEILNYRKNGTTFWNEVTIDPIRNDQGVLIGFIALLNACDDAQRTMAKKAAGGTILASITEFIPGYIYQRVMRMDGTIEMLYTSPSLHKLLGINPEDNSVSLSDYTHPEDRDPITAAIRKSAASMSTYKDKFRLIATDGSIHWLRSESMPRLNAENEIVWDGLAIDITAEKKWEDEVATLTVRDLLTGLLSRGAWREALTMQLNDETRDCALLYVDLSNFHQINERYGIQAGDDILCAIAQRLSGFATSIDGICARLGGDEFAVLISACCDTELLTNLGQSLLTAIALPIQIGDNSVSVQAVVGATLLDGNDESYVSSGDLMRQAEQALRSAKQHGANSFGLYYRERDESFTDASLLTQSLENAIANDELVLNYQPLVDIASGKIVSLEALVRWHHPVLGLLGPDTFIPLAEKSGFISQLGRWVLEEALRQRKCWSDCGLSVPPISLNVSRSQLVPELAGSFRECFAELGGNARDFELELTESLLIEASQEVMSCMQDLSDMGFSIAIDDFGSGYSTFRYLRDFPVDKLKLDQTYVKKLVLGSADTHIIRAMIALARGMGIAFVAEGIETEMQRDFLLSEGCEIGQGYFFSKPLIANDLRKLLS